jgi:hypothetical protein
MKGLYDVWKPGKKKVTECSVGVKKELKVDR